MNPSAVHGHELEVLGALGIEAPRHGHIRCPYSGHEDIRPSWRWDFINFRYYCSCGSGDVFDVVQKCRGGYFEDALRFVGSVIGSAAVISAAAPPRRPQLSARPALNKKRWSRDAEDFWRSCSPLSGIALDYLHARNCAIPPKEVDLRWHPALRHPIAGGSGPALVARVTDAITNEPMTLQQTWIEANGNKADVVPPRMMLKAHQKSGGVIRLCPDEELTDGLAIAEGVETALSAAIGFTPVWSVLDKGNLGCFPVIDGVEALTIIADNDEKGLSAAQKCSERWLLARKEVRLIKPDQEGHDFNDWVTQ